MLINTLKFGMCPTEPIHPKCALSKDNILSVYNYYDDIPI